MMILCRLNASNGIDSSGIYNNVKLREDTEIITPIGTVKSIVLSDHETNKNLKIVTNFAEADGFTGVIRQRNKKTGNR
ncbi:hypothetical protein [Treponema sp.]|uniref:hypothetical protein n=1 Tax=Treponema sp. TaxID=166 RepID=UPI003FA274D4